MPGLRQTAGCGHAPDAEPTYELEPGDSICFPSSTPHRYLNPTEETTRAVTVILPDGGMHGPPTNQRRP